jgi:hypothetical protein
VNQTHADTFIDGVSTSNASYALAPTMAQLSAYSSTYQVQGSKQASASASTTATTLGAAASAIDALHPDSTLTAATSYALVSYWAVLPSSDAITFNFKLDGTLNVTGSRALGADASRAGVAMLALGSITDGTSASYQQVFANLGFSATAQGDAMLAQLAALPTTSQRNLATLGASATFSHNTETVDTTLQVTADGTRIDCDGALVPACGNYFYFVNLMLFTGAQNGGVADFSHTLAVTSVQTAQGTALPFSAQTLSPVPEPAAAWLLLGGLGSLAAYRRRCAR